MRQNKQNRKFLQVIGLKIRTRRQQAGLTQQQLSDLIGVSRISVVNMEEGRHACTIETLMVLCRIFKCQYADLLPDLSSLKLELKQSETIRKIAAEKKKKIAALNYQIKKIKAS